MALYSRLNYYKTIEFFNFQLGLAKRNPRYLVFLQPKRSCADQAEPNKEKPVKFSTSPAAEWKAEYSRKGNSSNAPEAQTYVVSLSLFVFLYYFLVLREENDIDEKFNASLYNKFEGLEEMQLVTLYNYNEDKNIDNTEVINRLKELQAKKSETK